MKDLHGLLARLGLRDENTEFEQTMVSGIVRGEKSSTKCDQVPLAYPKRVTFSCRGEKHVRIFRPRNCTWKVLGRSGSAQLIICETSPEVRRLPGRVKTVQYRELGFGEPIRLGLFDRITRLDLDAHIPGAEDDRIQSELRPFGFGMVDERGFFGAGKFEVQGGKQIRSRRNPVAMSCRGKAEGRGSTEAGY